MMPVPCSLQEMTKDDQEKLDEISLIPSHYFLSYSAFHLFSKEMIFQHQAQAVVHWQV